MELNRNHYFMLGLVALFLGLQFKYVDSFVLSDEVSRILENRSFAAEKREPALDLPFQFSAAVTPPVRRKTVRTPSWLPWSLISVGTVLVLHSLAMRRPD